jgi:hypothetical protein
MTLALENYALSCSSKVLAGNTSPPPTLASRQAPPAERGSKYQNTPCSVCCICVWSAFIWVSDMVPGAFFGLVGRSSTITISHIHFQTEYTKAFKKMTDPYTNANTPLNTSTCSASALGLAVFLIVRGETFYKKTFFTGQCVATLCVVLLPLFVTNTPSHGAARKVCHDWNLCTEM